MFQTIANWVRGSVSDMYVAHQNPGDDMCRMHALNAVIGQPVLTPTTFEALAREWQALEPSPDTLIFESVHSDGRSFLAFALEECLPDCVACYVPFGTGAAALIRDDPEGQIVRATERALAFSLTHTWAVVSKPAAGSWWRLDSLGGGPRAMPHALRLDEYHGYVLVLPRTLQSRDSLLEALALRMRRMLATIDIDAHAALCPIMYENLETSIWAYSHVAQRCGTPLPFDLFEATRATRLNKCGVLNVARTLALACINWQLKC